MAKEFDIYLKHRVKECDLMVLSLPFRDGLTATNRMVLESCIETYLLHKFVAVQTGSNIVSHIDKMIKTCYEMLRYGTTIDISADFQTHYSVYPGKSIIEISTPDVSTLATMFTDAESAMKIGASPLLVSVGKSLGTGSSAIKFEVRLRNALKRSILKLRNSAELGAMVSGTNETNFISTNAAVSPTAQMVDLCYRATSAANTAFEIAALVLGTELHFSFGRAFSSVAFKSSVLGEEIQKFEAIKNTLYILCQMTETIIQYIEPDNTLLLFGATASSIVKRHRLLFEMDEDNLSNYDDMSIDEIDFVILP